jgi:hypothetical protein
MLQITRPPSSAARIQKARTTLLLDHPFFGMLLFRLGAEARSSIATMATSDPVSVGWKSVALPLKRSSSSRICGVHSQATCRRTRFSGLQQGSGRLPSGRSYPWKRRSFSRGRCHAVFRGSAAGQSASDLYLRGLGSPVGKTAETECEVSFSATRMGHYRWPTL